MQDNRGFSRSNPLVSIAAVALIIASVSVVGAIFGLIPSTRSDTPDVLRAGQVSDPAATRETPRTGAKGEPVRHAVNGCANCGVIESVRAVQVPGQGSGLGAVAGGVTGAVVGSQFGRGNGRTALGVLGAVGGAYAGNSIEQNVRSRSSYRVTVRMDDGTQRTISQGHAPTFATGAKVRVINGQLAAREVRPG